MRRVLTTALLALATVAGSLVAAAPASAATPTCTSSVSRSSTTFDPAGDRYTGSLPSASGSSTCVLNVGNNNAAVGVLQRLLNACFGRSLAVDNDYGTKTRDAVLYAQGVVGIPSGDRDGSYGPQTRTYFNDKSKFRAVSINFPGDKCVKFTSL